MVPEKKITVEDVKYVLSSHFQGTPYDPYAKHSDPVYRNKYRAIGINRTDLLSLIQIRPYMPEEFQVIQWVAFASNPFNVLVPFYPQVSKTPEYMANTTAEVSTENFYWASRMIAAMADASYGKSLFHVEHYQENVLAKSHALINQYDALLADEKDPEKQMELKRKANRKVAEMVQKEASATLKKVLYELSNQMKNSYARSDV